MSEQRAFRGIWIPADLWLNRTLSVMEKLMLVEIDSLDNDPVRGCYKKNQGFAEFFGLSKNRVSEIIKVLEKKGFIRIKYQKEGREIIERNIFMIAKFDKPALPVEKPNTPSENNDTPFGKAGYPYSENSEERGSYLRGSEEGLSCPPSGEPCVVCDGLKHFLGGTCDHCNGTGVEPRYRSLDDASAEEWAEYHCGTVAKAAQVMTARIADPVEPSGNSGQLPNVYGMSNRATEMSKPDWSQAPEGATHWLPNAGGICEWYMVENGTSYCYDQKFADHGINCWFRFADDGISGRLIPRPVQPSTPQPAPAPKVSAKAKGSAAKNSAAAKPKKQPSKRTRISEDWKPTESHRDMAFGAGVTLDDDLVANFIDYHTAKGSLMANWNAAFNTWIRNQAKFNAQRRPGGYKQQPEQQEEDWTEKLRQGDYL